MSFVIESFSRELNCATFDCGEESLNYWLHAQSSQQEKRGNTRTFLAREENVNHVVGYYSSVIAQIEASQSAQGIGVGTGRYPISAVLIARLAVDRKHQGSGLGSRLLVHVLRGALSISEHAGLEVVVVDALNVEAMAFYRRHGFASFEDNPLRLFVTLKQIAVSLRDLCCTYLGSTFKMKGTICQNSTSAQRDSICALHLMHSKTLKLLLL